VIQEITNLPKEITEYQKESIQLEWQLLKRKYVSQGKHFQVVLKRRATTNYQE
jgi:hypothetical protein